MSWLSETTKLHIASLFLAEFWAKSETSRLWNVSLCFPFVLWKQIMRTTWSCYVCLAVTVHVSATALVWSLWGLLNGSEWILASPIATQHVWRPSIRHDARTSGIENRRVKIPAVLFENKATEYHSHSKQSSNAPNSHTLASWHYWLTNLGHPSSICMLSLFTARSTHHSCANHPTSHTCDYYIYCLLKYGQDAWLHA